ncbi:MAG: beta-ketoacyl-ACP synthase 3 [Treponema sp.]|nr:beta-ketoacyl-ACP synthase 3 [Treponema sp.]
MAFEFIGTGRAVPSRKVSNSELAAQINTSDEWIRSHTGIGNRYIAGEDCACSDLALEAAKNALAMAAGFNGNNETDTAERDRAAAEMAEKLDVIVLTTASADFVGCPSTACVVQGRLGAKKAAAMDLAAGCTGFVYSVETAAGLLNIRPERTHALVIGSEVLSKITNWEDRGTCVLLGDGAGAAVIEKTGAPSEGNGKRGLLRTVLYADGTGWDTLIIRRGGTRYPIKKGEVVNEPIQVEMKGQEVYSFAVKAAAEIVNTLLKAEGISIDDLAWIVPHQANYRIIQGAARYIGIPLEKFFINLEEYANTSAATIPIALDEMNRTGKINRGDLIMTVGFGGGLAYGGNLIVW